MATTKDAPSAELAVVETRKTRRRRPPRNAQGIDDAWRAQIRESMERHGISLSELAAIIGCSKGTLHAALDPREQQPTFRYRDALASAIQRIVLGDRSAPVAPPPPPVRRRRVRVALGDAAPATMAPSSARGSAAAAIDENLRLERLYSMVTSLARTMTEPELEALAHTAIQLAGTRRT